MSKAADMEQPAESPHESADEPDVAHPLRGHMEPGDHLEVRSLAQSSTHVPCT